MLEKELPIGASTITDAEVKADEDGSKMMQLLEAAQEAIGKYLGKPCEIVIAVHPEHGENERCGVFVITPHEKPIADSARILHDALGGLQVILFEQALAMGEVQNGGTVN